MCRDDVRNASHKGSSNWSVSLRRSMSSTLYRIHHTAVRHRREATLRVCLRRAAPSITLFKPNRAQWLGGANIHMDIAYT